MPILNGQQVSAINSRLRAGVEVPDPRPLAENKGLCYQGVIVHSMGFTLTSNERDRLITHDLRNGERIFPYLGGKEIATHPEQMFHRYVIDFEDMPLEEVEQWPDLLAIVREKVKPSRKGKGEWWKFARPRWELREKLKAKDRCLIHPWVSTQLPFSFQPIGPIFSNTILVSPFTHDTAFSLLQSRVHNLWAWLNGSTLALGLRYRITSCFDTFPFPQGDPRIMVPELESIGAQVHEARQVWMRENNLGLTKCYNALRDPNETGITRLRELHVEMDRQVLKAYGWDDLKVPPYAGRVPQSFEDEVLNRLMLLNAERVQCQS